MNDYLKHIAMTEAGKKFLHGLGAIGATDILQPSDVAAACIDVLDKGTSGSVWFVHKHGKPAYEAKDLRSHEDLLAENPHK